MHFIRNKIARGIEGNMHWWQILLALVVGGFGTYLWSVPSKAFDEHLRKIWQKVKRKWHQF